MESWDYDVIKQLINLLCCHMMFFCCSLFFTIWVTSDPFSLSRFMLGWIVWFMTAAESTSQKSVSTSPKFSGRVVNWIQMPRRVVHCVIPRVLLARAHHPKLDDLNSISCLLSMRLHRHANNRKFALKGIDQQPLTLSHDSEVSHDSGAAERKKKPSVSLFSFTPPGEMSYRWDCPVSHSSAGGGNLTALLDFGKRHIGRGTHVPVGLSLWKQSRNPPPPSARTERVSVNRVKAQVFVGF